MTKLEKLIDTLKGYESLVIALSGGVDSSLLTMAAGKALGDRVVAITASSELLSEEELQDAKAMSEFAGVRHIVLEANDLNNAELVANDKNRCYYCKKGRFNALCSWAEEHGFKHVAEGSNLDDSGDYRPGMRAIHELEPVVVSPYMECGWNKADIRKQAKEWGLSVWDKPSAACLASRVEYGISLTPERLSQVEKAEIFLRPMVKGQLRVRHHGSIARVEVDASSMDQVFKRRAEINKELKRLGFSYVTLDLSGYRMGSQNEVLDK